MTMPATTAKPTDDKPTVKPSDETTIDNKTDSDKAADNKTTTDKPMVDEYGATVETLVVVQPIEEEEDDTCYIVYYENYKDEQGIQHRRAHRVPRENWDKYAKKHGF